MFFTLLAALSTSFAFMLAIAYLCFAYFQWFPYIGTASAASMLTLVISLIGFFRFLDFLSSRIEGRNESNAHDHKLKH